MGGVHAHCDLKQTTAFENSCVGSLFGSLDLVNDKYGEFSVARTKLQERTPAPRVISPSWRPGAPTPVAR
jgi:hypothetical protein